MFSPLLGAAVASRVQRPEDVWIFNHCFTFAGVLYTCVFLPNKPKAKGKGKARLFSIVTVSLSLSSP